VLGYDLEMPAARHMLFFTYEDRPGVIGKVGTILGAHDVNIGTMDVGRSGGTALMGLTLDSSVTPEVVEEVATAIGTDTARFIVLPD
jgi:D-3-phosphoglycerate dehydrogenase